MSRHFFKPIGKIESRETRDDLDILYISRITVPIFIPTIIKSWSSTHLSPTQFHAARWRIYFPSIPLYLNSNIEIPSILANHSPCFIVDVIFFKLM